MGAAVPEVKRGEVWRPRVPTTGLKPLAHKETKQTSTRPRGVPSLPDPAAREKGWLRVVRGASSACAASSTGR